MNDGSDHPSNGDDQNLAEIRLEFETMRQLQAELSPTLSNDGFFIPTPDPSPPDTVLRFSITLPEDFVLIAGTGVVIWVRRPGDPEGPAGMAVRYISLSRETQETIDAIIDAHLASGGSLFDLEPSAADDGTYPTDALGSSIGSSGAGMAGKTTERQLEKAKVTIRDSSQKDASDSAATMSNDYLASVEAQVAEAVASITPGDAAPPPKASAAGGEGPADELVGPAEEGSQPPADVGLPLDLGGPDVATDEPLEPIVVDAEPSPADSRLEDASGGSGDQGQAPAASSDEAVSPERLRDESIESLIPVFLEKWKQEIDGDPKPPPGDAGDDEAGKTVAVELPQPTHGDPTPSFNDHPAASDERLSGREPMERPGAEFEVSGFGNDSDSDIEAPLYDAPRDDEVTLAPSDPPPPKRSLSLWLIPVLLVAAVAVSVYFGWDRIQSLVGLVRPSEPATVEGAVEPEQIAEQIEAPTPEGDGEQAGQPPSGPERSGAEIVDIPPAADQPPPTSAPMHRTAAAPATRIDAITWRQNGARTEVTILGNGVIAEENVTVFPMTDPARILVRIRGIDEMYDRYEIPVESPQISRIRIGHHPEQTPPALYVVLDLVDPLAGVADFEVAGDSVRFQVEVQ